MDKVTGHKNGTRLIEIDRLHSVQLDDISSERKMSTIRDEKWTI